MNSPDPVSVLSELELELLSRLVLRLVLLLFLPRLQARTRNSMRPAASQAGWCFIWCSPYGLQVEKRSCVTPLPPAWQRVSERYRVRQLSPADLRKPFRDAASSPAHF